MLEFRLDQFIKKHPQRVDKLRPLLDLGILDENIILCGGALQVLFDKNLKSRINDFDLYFRIHNTKSKSILFQKTTLEILVEQTRNKLLNLGFKCIFECPEGKLYSYKKDKVKIQLIVEPVEERVYNTIESILNDFDLNCCLIACDGNKVYTYSNTVRDIRRKRLSLHRLLHPVSTLSRIAKYVHRKGYRFGNVRKEILQALGVDSNQWDMRGYID